MRLAAEGPVFTTPFRTAFAVPGSEAPALSVPPARPVHARPDAQGAALAGLRESRALAALAADIAERLAGADPALAQHLRSRLREAVEIGSARDTAGPLALLYAAARRDPDSPLHLVLAAGGNADPAALAEAALALRRLDKAFAAREALLAGTRTPAPVPAPTRRLDVLV